MNATIDDRELRRLEQSMARSGTAFEKGAQRLLKKLGTWVFGRSKDLCPESPTLRGYARENKSGKTRRSDASVTSGSLRDSISYEESRLKVEIGIPVNAKGGPYAEKIHDERGKTWNNLGPRSKQKGATDKFIFKAYDDSKAKESELIDKVIKEFTDSIGI